MGCSHAASVWPAGESTEWVADEEAEELAGQDEDEGIKLTAFNMAEERADGYFDEVHVAWKLTPGWCCKLKGKQPQGCREGQVAQYHAVAALRCAVRLIASFAEEHSCPDSAADATPAPACRAATTSRTRRMMKRRRTPGWPPGKEVRRPEHNLEVWHPEVCPAGANFRGCGWTELCFALDPATSRGRACIGSTGSALLCPKLACPNPCRRSRQQHSAPAGGRAAPQDGSS